MKALKQIKVTGVKYSPDEMQKMEDDPHVLVSIPDILIFDFVKPAPHMMNARQTLEHKLKFKKEKDHAK